MTGIALLRQGDLKQANTTLMKGLQLCEPSEWPALRTLLSEVRSADPVMFAAVLKAEISNGVIGTPQNGYPFAILTGNLDRLMTQLAGVCR